MTRYLRGLGVCVGTLPTRSLFILLITTFSLLPVGIAGQTTGSVRGRVLAPDSTPLAGVSVTVAGIALTAVTDSAGRYVIASVPAGERMLRFERIGFRPLELEGVIISLGRSTTLSVRLEMQPVVVPGVTVEAQRVRLIDPEISVTREIVLGRELRSLPTDRISDVVDLTPGVSGGHFRGGRVGQEVYVVDGLEVKNQLEASAHGSGLELPPGALEEVEVITGGVSATYGSALSGVVSYTTRRGDPEIWEGRASLITDQWAPDPLFRGFTGLAASAGGPLSFLGDGATLYVDVLGQGMADADPRARGLSCLGAGDADAPVAALIAELERTAPALYCPYTGSTLPHQRGDKLIGFGRFDAPLGAGVHLTLSALRNRFQRELYTPEFRYNPTHQLGQKSAGTLVSAGLDMTDHEAGRGRHVGIRLAVVQLDRHLGAIDPATFDDRLDIAGLGLSGFRFLGESFVRKPIADQLAIGGPVPGYAEPGGIASPFGAAGAGLFFTEGTPDVANWTRSVTFSADAVGELLTARGGLLRAGASTRLYRVETYERTLSHLGGASPSYARFYPMTLGTFIDARVAGDDELNVSAGLRLEAFRSGVRFRRDRDDFLAPVLEPGWQVALMPRFGVALPLPGSDGRTSVRFNYGQVAQPPDFRFFLDTTIGDSIRTAIQRQGNPELSFERGRTYELGMSQLIGEHIGVAVTAFRKELRELASGGLQVGSTGNPQYSTNDFGTVKGIELSVRGQWTWLALRAGYSLQKATGVASGTDADTLITTRTGPIEQPLAFDQRHAIDVAVLAGEAAGRSDAAWSAALIARAGSGYPRNRRAAAGDTLVPGEGAYLPWTSSIDLRVSRDLGRLPGCESCRWRVVADGRNVLGRDNVLALREDSGRLAPSLETIQAAIGQIARPAVPIPAESPLYTRRADLDGDGSITPAEFDNARLAAVLDRFDPSLLLGPARSVRLGLEVVF